MPKSSQLRKVWGVVAILACLVSPTTLSVAEDEDDEQEQKEVKLEDQPGRKEQASYDGNWELGLFVPYSYFDTEVPVKDNMGVDDAIRDTYGRGLEFGYNFTPKHAIVTHNSWVDSDSEDQRGATHFSIRTRYNLLNYRFTMWWGKRVAPFLLAGSGVFRARALDENHESFGGRTLTAGLGLRYIMSHRSSTYVMGQASRINLHPDDATNYVVAWGITAHLGAGPGSFTPSPEAEE